MSVHRIHREPNIYGYQFSGIGGRVPSPNAQLQTLLKLQNNKPFYRLLKRNILSLVHKHLDIKLTGSVQEEKLQVIETELKKLYPDIFAAEQSEKRLYFATRLILYEHSGRRHLLKKANRNENQQSGDVTQNFGPESNQQESKVGFEWKNNHRMPDQQVESKVGFEWKNNHRMPESASQILPRSNKSSMNIKPEITYKIHDPNEYHDIHNFLEASMPPMTHLFDAFINFGCINTDFLLAVSRWSSENIRDFLDQLSLGPNERQITEMEKFVLQNYFEDYSIQLGKRRNKSEL